MSLSLSVERDSIPVSHNLPTYRLYGMTLATDFDFANRLLTGSGSPDLTFACVSSAPLAEEWDQAEPAYVSPPRKNGLSVILIYRVGEDCWVIRFPTADFYLWPDRILCHLPNPEHHYLVEIQLLGVVLACWLELRGIPALHASAVKRNGRTAAFLSTSEGGKSSLAATMMKAGSSLLTDDILPVRRSDGLYLGQCGYPTLRMWPDQARHFLRDYEELSIVHPAYSKRRVPVGRDSFGTFCGVAEPLACLYLPERRNPDEWGTQIEFRSASRLEAMMALITHSFAVHMVEALGVHRQRWEFFAEMVAHVPVRKVIYPSGFDYLPYVQEAILNDFAEPSTLDTV